MTGPGSVSHLLSYTAAFVTHCKLQPSVVAGCWPRVVQALRSRVVHGLPANSSLDPLSTCSLIPFRLFVKKNRILLNDAQQLAWGPQALGIPQLMKHVEDCGELRVIKHLQGCFIRQRTTTRSTGTFHLRDLGTTAAQAHSWWSCPSPGAFGVALLMDSDAAIRVLRSICWKSHALKRLTLAVEDEDDGHSANSLLLAVFCRPKLHFSWRTEQRDAYIVLCGHRAVACSVLSFLDVGYIKWARLMYKVWKC